MKKLFSIIFIAGIFFFMFGAPHPAQAASCGGGIYLSDYTNDAVGGVSAIGDVVTWRATVTNDDCTGLTTTVNFVDTSGGHLTTLTGSASQTISVGVGRSTTVTWVTSVTGTCSLGVNRIQSMVSETTGGSSILSGQIVVYAAIGITFNNQTSGTVSVVAQVIPGSKEGTLSWSQGSGTGGPPSRFHVDCTLGPFTVQYSVNGGSWRTDKVSPQGFGVINGCTTQVTITYDGTGPGGGTPTPSTSTPPPVTPISQTPYCNGTISQVDFFWTRQQAGWNYEIWWTGSGGSVNVGDQSALTAGPLTPGISITWFVRAYLGSNAGPTASSTFTAASGCTSGTPTPPPTATPTPPPPTGTPSPTPPPNPSSSLSITSGCFGGLGSYIRASAFFMTGYYIRLYDSVTGGERSYGPTAGMDSNSFYSLVNNRWYQVRIVDVSGPILRAQNVQAPPCSTPTPTPTATPTPPPAGTADMTISFLRLNGSSVPITVVPGAAIAVDAGWRNNGTGAFVTPGGSFRNTLYKNQASLGCNPAAGVITAKDSTSSAVSPFTVGRVDSLSTNITAESAPGTYTVWIYTNSGCVGTESNSANNQLSLSYTVSGVGSIRIRIRAADASGFIANQFVDQATVVLTNTVGTPDARFSPVVSDSNGWVRYTNVPAGTYGLLAYKAGVLPGTTGFTGRYKQVEGDCLSNPPGAVVSTIGPNGNTGGVIAAFDNLLPVNNGTETGCNDLGLIKNPNYGINWSGTWDQIGNQGETVPYSFLVRPLDCNPNTWQGSFTVTLSPSVNPGSGVTLSSLVPGNSITLDCSSIPQLFSFNAIVAPTAVPGAIYTISVAGSVAGQPSLNRSIDPPGKLTVNVGNWLMTRGGDVWSGGDVDFAAAPPAGKTTGDYLVKTKGPAGDKIKSAKPWLLERYGDLSFDVDYQTLKSQAGGDTIATRSNCKELLENAVQGVYQCAGALNFANSNPWPPLAYLKKIAANLLALPGNLISGKKTLVTPVLAADPAIRETVVFINGDLDIRKNLTPAADKIILLVVSGRINISNDVTTVNAYLFADMGISTSDDPGVVASKLTIFGGVAIGPNAGPGAITFNRKVANPQDPNNPAETIIYDPRLLTAFTNPTSVRIGGAGITFTETKP